MHAAPPARRLLPARTTAAWVGLLSLLLVQLVTAAPPASAQSGDYPLVPYRAADGSLICDPTADQSPPYADIACDASGSSAYVGSDQKTLTAAFVLAGDPRTTTNQAPFDSTAYSIMVGSGGTTIGNFGMDGKGTNNSDVVYVKCFGSTALAYSKNLTQALGDGSVTVAPVAGRPAGSSYVRVTFTFPLSSLEGCGVTLGTPISLFFATSQAGSLDVINKDYFTGSSVSYGSLSSVKIGGGLELAKTSTYVSGANPPQVGEATTYDLVVGAKNTSLYPLADVRVTDVLPAGVTVVGTPSASAGTLTAEGRSFTWALGGLDPGPTRTLTVRVSVTPTAAQVGSAVLLNPGADGTATQTANGSALTARSPAVSTPNVVGQGLAVAKAVLPGSVVAGGQVAYTITLTNPGTAATALAQVTDTLPAGFTLVPGSTAGTLGAGAPTVSGQVLTWQGPFSLPVGGSRTLTFLARATGVIGTYPNTATGTGAAVGTVSTGPTAPVTVTSTVTATNDLLPVPPGGGTTTTSVLGNDLLNGGAVAPDRVALTTLGEEWARLGSTLAADGRLSVPGGIKGGDYRLTYRACEVLNPTVCATAVVMLQVPVGTLLLSNDLLPVAGAGGSTPSVLANDSLNGLPVDPARVVLTLTDAAGTGVTLRPDGTLSAPPGIKAGDYALTYQACEALNPTSCRTAVVTLRVAAGILSTSADAYVISGGGATTGSVLANDALNGAAVEPATVVLTLTDAASTGATLGADGRLTVPAGLKAGEYALTYRVCEALNPTSCRTAPVTITVAPGVLAASDDAYAVPSTGSTTASVLANDTLNGAAADPAAVVLRLTGAAGTGATLAADGRLTVPSGLKAGDYALAYQVCEALNPTSCRTATVTVTVAAGALTALADTYTVPATGSTTGSLLANDTLNGAATDPARVVLTLTDAAGTGATAGADGRLAVPAGLKAGDYALAYRVCEALNPLSCRTASVTVTVAPGVLQVARDELQVPATGGSGSVLLNDLVNGARPEAPAVRLTLVDAGGTGATLGADGVLSVPGGLAAGPYQLTYRLCEVLNPASCADAGVRAVVAAGALVPTTDVLSVPGAGGTTASVLANDLLNGAAVAAGRVAVALVSADGTGATLDAEGRLRVPDGLAAGDYDLAYRVCEVLNPDSCRLASITLTVAAGVLAPGDDVLAVPATGGRSTVLTSNDLLDGRTASLEAVRLSLASDGGTGVLLTDEGLLVVPSGLAAGTYAVTYRTCEVLNPLNCAMATVTVTVAAGELVAAADRLPVPSGGGATGSVLENDLLNGAQASADATRLTLLDDGGTGAALGADGRLTVPAGLKAGEYALEYRVCEQLNPKSCRTAPVLLVVAVGELVPADDIRSAPPAGATLPSLLVNDRLDDAPAAAQAVTLRLTDDGGTGATLADDGALTVPAGLPAGDYRLAYEVCERLNPDSCRTARVALDVMAGTLALLPEERAVTGAGGTVATVLLNDLVDGAAADAERVTVELLEDDGTGATLAGDGRLSVPAGVQAGTYALTYQVCERLNPQNCATGSLALQVAAAELAVLDDHREVPAAGGTTASVLTNDLVDGQEPAAERVVLRLTDDGATGAELDGSGALRVPEGLAAGTYTLTYELCEALNPSSCGTATLTLVVEPAQLAVEPDVRVVTTDGGPAATVLTNDTLDDQPATAETVTVELQDAGGTGVVLEEDGTLVVPPGLPAGTYELEHDVCQRADEVRCVRAGVTLVVTDEPLLVADDDRHVPNDGGTTPPLTANDVLAGEPLAPAAGEPAATQPERVDVRLVDDGGTGAALDDDAALVVPGGLAPSDYALEYELCTVEGPRTCDRAEVELTVEPPAVVATDDRRSTTGEGGTVASVIANDLVGGEPVAPGTVLLTLVEADATGAVLGADGALDVPAGLAAGEYQLTYRACARSAPDSCDEAEVLLEVTPGVLVVADDARSVEVEGGVLPSLLANDTLDGAPVAAEDVRLTLEDADGTAATLADGGALTVPAGVVPGTYALEYEVCEARNPATCDTGTVRLVVEEPEVEAEDDRRVITVGGGELPSVVVNDGVDGTQADDGAVVVSVTEQVEADVEIAADGTVGVGREQEVGRVEIPYQLCSTVATGACDEAVLVLDVRPPTLEAVDEVLLVSDLGDTGSVLENELVGQTTVPTQEVSIELAGDGGTAAVVEEDGRILVPQDLPDGQYEVAYEVCLRDAPDTCALAEATLQVGVVVVEAQADGLSVPAAGGTTESVLENDTLDGQPLRADQVVLELLDAAGTAAVLEESGALELPATPSGSETLSYEVCDRLHPTVCDVATVDLTVVPRDLEPADDLLEASPGEPTASVLANDRLDGAPVTPAQVELQLVDADGTQAVLDDDGVLVVPVGTAPGAYDLEYRVCEQADPQSCRTADVVLTVVADEGPGSGAAAGAPADGQPADEAPAGDGPGEPAVVVARDDRVELPQEGGSTGTVLANDEGDGEAVDPEAVVVRLVDDGGTGATPNANGTLTVEEELEPGDYLAEYEVCGTQTCDRAEVVITVVAAEPAAPTRPEPVAAQDDALTVTADGGVTGSVLDNDAARGATVDPDDVTVEVADDGGTGAVANPNGTLTVAEPLAEGRYGVEYTVCERGPSGTCDTATAVLTVTAPAEPGPRPPSGEPSAEPSEPAEPGASPTTSPSASGEPSAAPSASPQRSEVQAQDDAFLVGRTGGATGSVLDNDRRDGEPVDPGEVTLRLVSDAGTAAELAEDGTLRLPADLPGGDYTLVYDLCLRGDGPCDRAVVVVTVPPAPAVEPTAAAEPAPTAADDAFRVPRNGGSTESVLANDRRGTQPLRAEEVTLQLVGDAGTGARLAPDGTITVPAALPGGAYELVYEACDAQATDDCGRATVALTVPQPEAVEQPSGSTPPDGDGSGPGSGGGQQGGGSGPDGAPARGGAPAVGGGTRDDAVTAARPGGPLARTGGPLALLLGRGALSVLLGALLLALGHRRRRTRTA